MKNQNRSHRMNRREMETTRGGWYGIFAGVLVVAAAAGAVAYFGGKEENEETTTDSGNTWIESATNKITSGCWDGPGGGFGEIPL